MREEDHEREGQRLEKLAKERSQFNRDLRKPDGSGRLSMNDLKKLNSVYKRDYIRLVKDDNNQLMSYLKETDIKI